MRLVSFDPISGKTVMYGHPIDSAAYSKNSGVRTGDIVVLDNQYTLLTEQGRDKNSRMRSLTYKVDLSKASDLSDFDKPGGYPELDDEKTLSQCGITFTQEMQVADLCSLGWQWEKAEGLAPIDNETPTVVNDSGLGMKVAVQHPVEDKILKSHRVSVEGKLTFDDKQVETTLRMKPLEKLEPDSEPWIMTLSEALR